MFGLSCLGLFEWSMKYQDGTSPANMPTEELTPEKKAWWVIGLHGAPDIVYISLVITSPFPQRLLS